MDVFDKISTTGLQSIQEELIDVGDYASGKMASIVNNAVTRGDTRMSKDFWPTENLEQLNCCPICGNFRRETLYENLQDLSMHVAPGRWSLHQCRGCGVGYLDPRPTPNSILSAYANYVTHGDFDQPVIRRNGRIKAAFHDLINGYLNAKYRLSLSNSLSAGRLIIPFLLPLRSAADSYVRHLAPPRQDQKSLLDIGCGNGGFLLLASAMGWKAEGIDVDPDAVASARNRGVYARCGGLELFSDCRDTFDVVTISHVIEHLHDPIGALYKIRKILKPGGTLWLETPNLTSFGHSYFGEYWRGLEAPRHLVLFNSTSLRFYLERIGFHSIKQVWRGLSGASLFVTSEKIREQAENRRRVGAKFLALLFEVTEMLMPKRRAFLTIIAKK